MNAQHQEGLTWLFSSEISDIRRKMLSEKPFDQECPERLIFRRCMMNGLNPVWKMTNSELFQIIEEFDQRLCSGMTLRDNFMELDKFVNKIKCRVIIEDNDLNYKKQKRKKK